MPIYEFRCYKCGRKSELYISSNEKIPKCQYCGSAKLEKLISTSYFVKTTNQPSNTTCCGQDERCNTPPCSINESCQRH